MAESEVRAKLEAIGRWRDGLELEPFEWLTALAPEGALDGIAAYRLIDPDYTPARDAQGRGWTPVADLGDAVLVDPSPAMFDGLLRRAGYFDHPEAFKNPILMQFHRFALDYYDGCQVREESFSYAAGVLTVQGHAFRGAGPNMVTTTFETVARRDKPAAFLLHLPQ